MPYQRFVPIIFFLFFLTTCTTLPDYVLSSVNPPIAKTRSATLLSAFFGLDNALPITASGIWKDTPGKDGMPLVFSHEIDPKTLDATDFLITTRDGSTRKVGFASFKPAVEAFELRTILLIGELGNAPNNEPVEVSIVGDLKSRDGQNLKGQKIAVTPLEEGPFLSYAEFFTLDDDYPYHSKKRGCDCPKNTTAVVVRTVWAGGVHALYGNVIDLKKKSECESLFLSHHTSKKLNTLAMRTKVKNILSGMKDFVQTVLKKRKEYFVDEHVFTRNRRLDFSNLCFF